MICCILSLLFIILEGAFGNHKLKNFVEIKVEYNSSNFNFTNLTVKFFNSNKDSHVAAAWMDSQDLDDKKIMLCDVRTSSFHCFCQRDIANCDDFYEVLNAIYMISRDKPVISIPDGWFELSGKPLPLERLKSLLTSLYRRAPALSDALRTEMIKSSNHRSVPHVKQNDSCFSPANRTDMWKIKTPEFAGLRFDNCSGNLLMKFYSRTMKSLDNHLLANLTKKATLIKQLNSDHIQLSHVSSNGAIPSLDEFKRIISDKLNHFNYIESEYERAAWAPLNKESMYSFKDKPKKKEASGVLAIIVAWSIASIFMVPCVFIIQVALFHKFIEDRTPLNPRQFKLKDIEIELTSGQSGINSANSFMTIEAIEDLEKAKQSFKRKQDKVKGKLLCSVVMPTASDNSDLGSVHKPISSGRNTDMLAKRKFAAEWLCNEFSNPDKQAIHTDSTQASLMIKASGRSGSRQVPLGIQSDQGSLAKKKLFNENVDPISLQKTQSLSSRVGETRSPPRSSSIQNSAVVESYFQKAFSNKKRPSTGSKEKKKEKTPNRKKK